MVQSTGRSKLCSLFSVCSSCLEHVHAQQSPATHVFNFRDANINHLAGCPSFCAVFWLKRDGQSITTAAQFFVWAQRSQTRFLCAQTKLLPHLSCTLPEYTGAVPTDSGSDGEQWPGMAHLSSHLLNVLDFVVSRAKIRPPPSQPESIQSVQSVAGL